MLLAACSPTPSGGPPQAADTVSLDCALDGAVQFESSCTIEREAGGLTVRRPDGGFHRLAVDGDLAVSTADGASALQGTPLPDGSLEVTIGGDRYRLPAR